MRPGLRCARKSCGELVCAQHYGRLARLLRHNQEAGAAQPAAGGRARGPLRQWNRKDQSDDHRRHPGEQRERDLVGGDREDEAEQRVPAITSHHVAPRHGAVVALLRAPAGSRPIRMPTTEADWISIITGAIRPEITISRMRPARARAAPKPRRAVRSASMTRYPMNFGASNSPIVPANTHAARIGSCAGHCG